MPLSHGSITMSTGFRARATIGPVVAAALGMELMLRRRDAGTTVRADSAPACARRTAPPRSVKAITPVSGARDCRSLAPGEAELPRFTRNQVAQRNGQDGRPVWVTLGSYVYDVTAYTSEHPGGRARLLQAAGGPVEPWWHHWAAHWSSAQLPRLLQRMRIGCVADDEADSGGCCDDDADGASRGDSEAAGSVCGDDEATKRESAAAAEGAAMWADEPQRSPALLLIRRRPMSSHTIPSAMAIDYLTRTPDFFVRNHAPVPRLDAKHHAVAVGAQAWSVEQLRTAFPQLRVVSTLQCTGNRAQQMVREAKRRGDAGRFDGGTFETIGVGMLGCAVWEGPRLRDVLLRAYPWLDGLSSVQLRELHCVMEGVDGYETSVPLGLAMDETRDALVALRMNGEELPADHGAPARVLMPGVAGARNVKWVRSIRVASAESDAPWTQHYYRAPCPAAERGSRAIQLLPLQSLILDPVEGELVPFARVVEVRGVAWGGGEGSRVARVEVSADGGNEWAEATLLRDEAPHDDSSPSREWGWVRWVAKARMPPLQAGSASVAAQQLELRCRAVNEAGEEQPEDTRGPLKSGYLFNGHHRVAVRVPWRRDGVQVPW